MVNSVDLVSQHDAFVMQSRGSTRDGTGVHDSIVNQLLTKVCVTISNHVHRD